ncbi:MAG: UDP-N-acetylmuramoyl-tripeptide--D-alanyl-D-alanine ligase [Bacteroidales bacterium]
MSTLKKVHELILTGHTASIDSREIDEGSIFFALKGEKFDGNKFALKAIENGAIAAVVDNKSLMGKKNIICVDNVLVFLQELAIAHRETLNIPVIGLTGSNGKTTTKELINRVLSTKYKTFATKGNLNNHIGVPLSILSVSKKHEIAIIEMGANHIGEIAELCRIAKPTHGLITNIGKAHLEGFGSIEGVIKAKSELYAHLEKNNGVTFINSENKKLVKIAQQFDFKKRIGYQDAFSVLNADSVNGFLNFSMNHNNTYYDVTTNIVGEYNFENILAALAVGNYFGVDMVNAIKAIEAYMPNNSRSQRINTRKNVVILDAYNANPTSMELALTNFDKLPANSEKLVILGDMLELGEYTEKEHTRIGNMAKRLFNNVILVGDNFKHIEECQWFKTSLDCLNHLKSNPKKGFTILVKASRGVGLDKVLEGL